MRAGNVQEEEEEGLTPTPRLQQAAPVAPLPKPAEPAKPEQPEDQGKTEQVGAKEDAEKGVAKKEKEEKEQTKVPASTPAKQSGRPAARAALQVTNSAQKLTETLPSLTQICNKKWQESASKANSATPGVVSLASLGFATGGGKAKSKG